MMKKLYALVFGLLLVPALVQARTDSAATAFVRQTADTVITDILSADISQDEKLTRFRAVYVQALDLKAIGQFVLGVYWKKATPADRTAFLDAFEDFTTKIWADRFNLYNGERLTFTGERTEKNSVYITSQFPHNPPVEIIWRLRAKADTYRIVDIIVEGVSMAMSYRNEYTTFLQSHGGSVPALTAELKQKSDAFVWGQAQKEAKNKK